MGETGAVEIAFVVDEDLGLVHEPPEGGGMDDPVPVPVVLVAIGRRGLGETAAVGLVRVDGVGG
jgi:hypothetical protein